MRGQTDAPFQLMVAVIVFGVMLAAIYSQISSAEEETCHKKNRSELLKMKELIEKAYALPGTTVLKDSIVMNRCTGSATYDFGLMRFRNCADCPANYDLCWKLVERVRYGSEEPYVYQSVCLDISGDTDIYTSQPDEAENECYETVIKDDPDEKYVPDEFITPAIKGSARVWVWKEGGINICPERVS